MIWTFGGLALDQAFVVDEPIKSMIARAEVCALSVAVETTEREAVVAVEEEGPERVTKWLVNGTAGFCGLGIRPASAFVGKPRTANRSQLTQRQRAHDGEWALVD